MTTQKFRPLQTVGLHEVTGALRARVPQGLITERGELSWWASLGGRPQRQSGPTPNGEEPKEFGCRISQCEDRGFWLGVGVWLVALPEPSHGRPPAPSQGEPHATARPGHAAPRRGP